MPNYNRKDHYYQKAKNEGFRSRAAFKLMELDKKYKLLKKNSNVLDLGCAPGAWLQVVSKKVTNGTIIGVDLLKVKEFRENEIKKTPIILHGDAREEKIQGEIINLVNTYKLDIVLSDMSPNLSGIKLKDALESANLVLTAFDISKKLLKKNGKLVAKIFPGEEVKEVILELKKSFASVNKISLKTTRKTSKEFYIVASNFKMPLS